MDKSESLYQQVSLRFQPLGQIEALVLTTFGLDVEYLEKSILPAFFPVLGEGPVSEPHRPLFEYLEETHTPISVLYDANNLVRGETTLSASTAVLKELRWQSFPIIRSSGCFHPKAVLALTRKDNEQAILVGCSSANLTRPGWGRNFEACAFETVPLKEGMRSALLEEVYDMVVALLEDANGSEALQRIKSSIDKISMNRYKNKPSISASTRLWFGHANDNKKNAKSLTRWVQDTAISASELQSEDVKWHLDVLSPYFSDTPPELLRWVNDCFKRRTSDQDCPPIRIYCPRDGEQLNITASTYSGFKAIDHVCWSEFRANPLASDLRDQDGNRLQRFLHAKVYRFWSSNREIIVVGSANASRQGHRDDIPGNDEACLVLHRHYPDGAPPLTSWLRPLSDELNLKNFKVSVVQEDRPPETPVPAVTLQFDWETCEFNAISKDSRSLKLYLNCAIEPFLTLPANANGSKLKFSKSQVDAFFRSASVKVIAPECGDNAWLSLVAEFNLHLKPPAPKMERNIDDLIRDWQLSPEQRQAEHISRAAMPLEHLISNNPSQPDAEDVVDVDRLNDLFLAMHRFRHDISNNVELAGQDPESFAKLQLRSRLFGNGVMSVRYFLDRLLIQPRDMDGGFDVVEQYLGVMSLKDSLERLQPELKKLGFDAEFKSLSSEVTKKCEQVRRDLKTQLESESDAPNPVELLKWVEESFNYDQRIRNGVQR